MTQEMKLLTALTEALGFDIETTRDYQERLTLISPADVPYMGQGGRRYVAAEGGMLVKNEKGEYKTVLISPIVEYKLTKRAE